MNRRLVALALVGVMGGMVAAPQRVAADSGSGAGVGALGGALVGSLSGPAKNRMENSLIGAVAGGLLGYAIGNESEKQGAVVVNRTLEVTPSYATSTWVNPETNVTYLVTPQPARYEQGRICREVNIQARIDARNETLTGLTCRDEYGQWRLVDRNTESQPVPVVMAPPPQTVVVTRPVTRYVYVDPYYPYPASGITIYQRWGPSPYGHRHRHHHNPYWR